MSLEKTWLFATLAGFVLSFVGSLPPGLISLTVTNENIRRGVRSALWIALGASLVEMIQAFVSVQFSQMLSIQEGILPYFRWASVLVFLALGIYLFAQKPRLKTTGRDYAYRDFLLGVVVSSLNFLAYPYWIFYGTYLQAESWLGMSIWDGLFLGIGVCGGTFLAMLVYISLSKWMVDSLPQVIGAVNKGLGLLFILLAAWQLYQVASPV